MIWAWSLLIGAIFALAVVTFVLGIRRTPVRVKQPKVVRARDESWWGRLPQRTQRLAIASAVLGLVIALLTQWVIAIVILPALVLGLPWLLGAGNAGQRIARLEAMEEWTRSLAGVLTVGVGLEQAIIATLRSAPKAIQPEVRLLAARLRARWPTGDALRAFADDLDDSTGDLLAANLLLGAQRRGAGLASVLESVAMSVAEDVRARRMIEADRAKPRATARWVTIITMVVLGILFFTNEYVEPYKTGIGQIALAALLSLYVAALVWMKQMAKGKELPRFIGTAVAEETD